LYAIAVFLRLSHKKYGHSGKNAVNSESFCSELNDYTWLNEKLLLLSMAMHT